LKIDCNLSDHLPLCFQLHADCWPAPRSSPSPPSANSSYILWPKVTLADIEHYQELVGQQLSLLSLAAPLLDVLATMSLSMIMPTILLLLWSVVLDIVFLVIHHLTFVRLLGVMMVLLNSKNTLYFGIRFRIRQDVLLQVLGTFRRLKSRQRHILHQKLGLAHLLERGEKDFGPSSGS
jgi:hypothetical protein